MTQYQGIRLIAKALCLTVTDKTDFVRDLKSKTIALGVFIALAASQLLGRLLR